MDLLRFAMVGGRLAAAMLALASAAPRAAGGGGAAKPCGAPCNGSAQCASGVCCAGQCAPGGSRCFECPDGVSRPYRTGADRHLVCHRGEAQSCARGGTPGGAGCRDARVARCRT